MKAYHDPVQGFLEEGFTDQPYTHDIPDSEWKAYRTLVDAANNLEDRFVAGYAIEVDEYSTVRGILTDEQIETLRGLGIRPGEPPENNGRKTIVTGPDSAPRQRPAISVEQAAQEIIKRNAHKCQHRHQSGPFADGSVRCADCGGIIYGGTGVRKSINDADERDFHNPGKVDPRVYEGTV